jgi:hypothetical protein
LTVSGSKQRNPIPQPPYTKGLAAVLTFALLWLIMNPLYRNGYVAKEWGTLFLVVAAAIAYLVAQWWCKPKGPVA